MYNEISFPILTPLCVKASETKLTTSKAQLNRWAVGVFEQSVVASTASVMGRGLFSDTKRWLRDSAPELKAPWGRLRRDERVAPCKGHGSPGNAMVVDPSKTLRPGPDLPKVKALV